MPKLTFSICDSNHALVDEIIIDNTIIKPDQYISDYRNGKKQKIRKYSNNLVKSILEENHHYSDFVIIRWDSIKRDGILTEYPSKIKMITHIVDDRPLPDIRISDAERQLAHINRMFMNIFRV